MLPKTHTIFGFIFALVLALIFPQQIGWLGFIIIWASSVLIDVDHYLLYVWYKKDLSLKRAVDYFFNKAKIFKKLSKEKQKQVHVGIFFLHGIEMILITWGLFFLSKMSIFLYISIGFAFHLILDLIHMYAEKFPCYRLSFFYSIYAQRNKKPIEDIKL
jgi:hypothetical protein